MIWTAGVRAASMLDQSGLQQARQGRLVVGPTLQLKDHPEVFVIGDAAYLEADGQPLQMMATVAMQQGAFVAENIRRLVQGEPLKTFRYQDPGSLATIGRNQAVVRLGRLSFLRFHRLADLGGRAYLPADRVPQPFSGDDQLDLGLLHVRAWHPLDHTLWQALPGRAVEPAEVCAAEKSIAIPYF